LGPAVVPGCFFLRDGVGDHFRGTGLLRFDVGDGVG